METTQDYENLELLVEPDGAGYRVRVWGSHEGTGIEHRFELPWSARSTSAEEGPVRDVRRPGATATANPREVGTRLFEAVIQGDVREHYRVHRTTAERQDRGLRLRFLLRDAPELTDLPWEALYDPEKGQFLAMMPGSSVLRGLRLPKRRSPPRPLPPLRIVVAVAEPEGVQALDAGEELRRLKEALRPLLDAKRVVLEHLPRATAAALRERLEDGPPCHILHVVGHGTFDTARGGGHLILEDEKGQVDQVGTERLGSILQAHRHLRLVFLNVCEGGRGDGADPFAGIAQSLLRHGVPSVLAMGASIRDDLAVSFASGFYRSLARSGSIETAAAEARASLFSSSGHRAWATPVFYVRNLGDLDLRTAMAPRRLRRAAPWLAAGLGAALLGGALLRPAAPTEDARCPSPPGVDLDLRLVSEGTFRMGEGEGTLVRVEHDFCLGRTEVTQAVWAKMLGDGADDPSFYRSPDRPVHGVTWRQVRTFVDRLNQAYDDDPFRLPTEVEWEYAARNRGDLDPDLEDDPVWVEAHGNCISTTGNDGYDGVAPVASFAADPGGFYDLRGNVFEWVEEHTEGHGPPRAIAAGGSFESSPDNCRPTHRSPRDSFRVFRDQGFRIARNPLPEDGED